MGHGGLESYIREELSMSDYKITCDNGSITIIRANKRSTAIKLFCKAEGCSEFWFCAHCRVTLITPKKKKSIEEILEGIREDD
jgi:hypothetical protein